VELHAVVLVGIVQLAQVDVANVLVISVVVFTLADAAEIVAVRVRFGL
jgi:hypothetical protein